MGHGRSLNWPRPAGWGHSGMTYKSLLEKPLSPFLPHTAGGYQLWLWRSDRNGDTLSCGPIPRLLAWVLGEAGLGLHGRGSLFPCPSLLKAAAQSCAWLFSAPGRGEGMNLLCHVDFAQPLTKAESASWGLGGGRLTLKGLHSSPSSQHSEKPGQTAPSSSGGMREWSSPSCGPGRSTEI